VSEDNSLKPAVVKALKARGAFVYVTPRTVYGKSGIPDLVICYYGASVWMELKNPGEQATAEQLLVIDQIIKAGGWAAIIHSVQEAMDFLDEVDSYA
jgi:hypothetical protein